MIAIDTTVPIYVLRRQGDSLHHGGLAIARSAGRLGVTVHGVHDRRMAPAALSRYDRGALGLPFDGDDDHWLEGLCAIGERLGDAVLVPIDDASAVFVEAHAETLRRWFRFPTQPPGLSRTLSNKRDMHNAARELGIPTPDAEFPEGPGAIGEAAARLGEPVVLKQIDGRLPSFDPGAASVMIVDDADAAVAAYERMDSPAGPNVMLQRYVPGGSDSVWMFNGYFDSDSECLFGVTGQKLRQRGPHTGPTTLGIVRANETVEDLTRRLMKAVGYRGILDIGYRFDERDGEYKLLDVNPRIGASFRLFVGEDGMDVLRALYLDITGQPVPRSRARDGRRWLVEPYDLVASAQLAHEGELRASGWARSFRGVEEGAWFALDDPLPFAAMGARMVAEVLRRSRRRAVRA